MTAPTHHDLANSLRQQPDREGLERIQARLAVLLGKDRP